MSPVANNPIVPPFTRETAIRKVRAAEDAWNTRDPQRVALAYSLDSQWRNRSEFIHGRDEIVALLTRKWARELDYRLIKELWVLDGRTSPSGSPMSRMTHQANGSAPTGTRIGSSILTA